MKIAETLTTAQKINLLNGNAVGIFPYIFSSTDPYYSQAQEMCLGYYLNRSGSKTISPFYERIINLSDDTAVTQTPDEIVGKYIRSKFKHKWDLEYDLLLVKSYNALTDHSETIESSTDETNTKEYDTTVSHGGRDTDTLTYDTDLSHTGTDTNEITYDVSIEDNGTRGTKETVESSERQANDVYGFNSLTPVGDNTSLGTTSETTTGLPNDNTTHNVNDKTGTETHDLLYGKVESKTGTETKAVVYNNTEDKDGTETNSLEKNVSETKSGYSSAPSELLTKELDFRNSQIFFDIVYNDIDSITTLQIYI